jgi:hypothetical protein
VILGIGKANFDAMEELDADDTPLMDKGRKAARDLVQFVPFRNFKNDPAKLAEHVLKGKNQSKTCWEYEEEY